MIAFSVQLVLVAALFLASLAVRATSHNRHVRRRQRLTLILTFAWLAAEFVLAWTTYPPQLTSTIRSIAEVGLALALINFAVVVGVNPHRVDRAPEGFPVILQDTVIVALFALAATVLLRERVLALSAVGAVVLGFALQDTLGNAFAGLAIQTEKPFDVGQWIRVADREGQVTEITWRATKLRTKDNSFLIVPNNVMSREVVLNYSEPVLPTRIAVEVGASYDRPPNEVKAAIFEAIKGAPLVLSSPEPSVLVTDFAASSVTYRARFWIDDFAQDEVARDQVRTGIWYIFKRHGIEIPFPIQVEYSRDEPLGRSPDLSGRFARTLRAVEVFASLTEEDLGRLAEAANERLFASGEVVVTEGAPGDSMFVVERGEVEVVLASSGVRVARIGPAGFFGEMSLLTGVPRSATVRATTDALLMEIGAEAFRQFVLEKPEVLETISGAAIRRRGELEQSRQAASASGLQAETPTTFLSKVRRFLGLYEDPR